MLLTYKKERLNVLFVTLTSISNCISVKKIVTTIAPSYSRIIGCGSDSFTSSPPCAPTYYTYLMT